MRPRLMAAASKPPAEREGRIRYVDVARQHQPLKEELLAAAAAVIDHGRFVLGPEVAEFEQRFAGLCGVRHAVGVNSGTDALIMALRLLGIGEGDEVITAPNSFVATASAIALLGARPVFADVGDDYNLDPDAVRAAIGPSTRAILPVHLTGRPARMSELCALAVEHDLAVIEDCAQAVLAESGGHRVGSFGAVGCFSLHPLKTLNACGDGGVLTLDDESRAEELRELRNIGLRTRDDAAHWSGNSRLDTIQAAMLIVKLGYVEEWTRRRRENAAIYTEALEGIPELELPGERDDEIVVYHTYVVQAERRDELRAHLASAGIETNVHYPVPIHLQSVGRRLGYAPGDFPVAERQATRILSLPVYPELDRADVEAVAASIRSFYAR